MTTYGVGLGPACFDDLQSLMLAILVVGFLIGIWRLVIDGILRSTWNYRHVVLTSSEACNPDPILTRFPTYYCSRVCVRQQASLGYGQHCLGSPKSS